MTLFLVVNQVLVARGSILATLQRQARIHKVIAIYEVSVRVGLHMAHNVIIKWSQKKHEAEYKASGK